jgi:hypothetical protein
VIVFGSIPVGHPFTESYARHTAPAAVWHTRQFHAINQRISAVWGLAFLAGTISLLIAGSVSDRQVLLRVIVPFGALYLAYRYTQKQIRQAQAATPAGEPRARRDVVRALTPDSACGAGARRALTRVGRAGCGCG